MSKWPLELLLSCPFYLNFQSLLFTNGSNACNFIALLLAKFYILCSFIKQIHVTSLKPDKSIYYNCISLWNRILDSVTTGNVQLEDSFHLSILNKNPMVPQSSLGFYLERLTKEDNLAAVVITNGMTISLVGKKQQHYSHRRPLTWSIWCHSWHNQCW